MFNQYSIAVIINCAGNGVRFKKNKLIQSLGSKPILIRTIEKFLIPEIDEIIITVNQHYYLLYEKLIIKKFKLPVKLIIGGKERYESTYNGLRETNCDYVLIHDGVRPFITKEKITELLHIIKNNYKAAILALPTTTTIKKINLETMEIKSSLLRKKHWLAQTPQLFERKLLLTCYNLALKEKYELVSDDSELITSFTKEKIKIIPGLESNIKITYPQDLLIARSLLKEKSLAT